MPNPIYSSASEEYDLSGNGGIMVVELVQKDFLLSLPDRNGLLKYIVTNSASSRKYPSAIRAHAGPASAPAAAPDGVYPKPCGRERVGGTKSFFRDATADETRHILCCPNWEFTYTFDAMRAPSDKPRVAA